MKKKFQWLMALSIVMTPMAVSAAPVELVPHVATSMSVSDCDVTAVSGMITAISMDEHEDNVDRNGDGDTSDRVLGYYDVGRNTLVNTGITIGYSVSIDGDIIAFQYADSGNLGYYSIKDGSPFDTGVNLANFGRSYHGTTRVVSGGKIAFVSATRDLNGDRIDDEEISFYDTATRKAVRTRVMGSDPSFSGDLIAFILPSGTVGYYRVTSATTTDTGIIGSGPVVDRGVIAFNSPEGISWYDTVTRQRGITPFRDIWADHFGISNGIIAILAEEREQGDLNGDGDAADSSILVAYEISTGRTISTGVQGCCGLDISDGLTVFDTYEGDVGVDLNGDGDQNDCVQQYVLLRNMKTLLQVRNNMAVADCDVSAVSGTIIAISMDEHEDNKDYNADGDTNDRVLGYYNTAWSSVINTGIAIGYSVSVDGDIIAFQYASTGNLGYYSISKQMSFDTNINVSSFGRSYSGPTRAISAGRIVYTSTSKDLNGDGTFDSEICIYDTKTLKNKRTGIIGTDPSFSGNLIAFVSPDRTISWYNVSTGVVTSTGIEGAEPVLDHAVIVFKTYGGVAWYDTNTRKTGLTPFRDIWVGHFSISNGIISVLVDERNDWGDLNGDGDTNDSNILVLYDITSGRIVNTGVQGCCGTDMDSGMIVFDTYEGDIETDLNGDGDTGDCIQQYVIMDAETKSFLH